MSRLRSTATPAIQAVTAGGVWHRVHTYEHEAGAAGFGAEAAQKLGIAPQQIFKTLVVQDATDQLANAVVAVADMLDFRRLAAALDTTRVELADVAVVQRKTGYVLGGISPLGQRTALPMVVDTAIQDHHQLVVSGGRRGMSLELRVTDFLELTGASLAPIRRGT